MIAIGLSCSETATKHFEFIAVPVHLGRLEDSEFQAAIAQAALVFVQQVSDNHLAQINGLRPDGSELICLPNLVMRSPWPFGDFNEFKDDMITRLAPNASKRMHDGALALLRKIEPDREKRIARYRNLDFDLASRVDRMIEAQERFLEHVDSVTDTHIGRYILWHSKDVQLFYNSTHPSGLLFQKLCEFAWRRIGLPSNPPAFAGVDFWRPDSCPIHPEIARRLGWKWANERTLYCCNELGMVTWEDWVGRHIDMFG